MSSPITKYINLIKNLLPQGYAWENIKNSPVLEAMAGEFLRVGGQIEELKKEIDPNQTSQLIQEWESLVGIPDECTPLDRELLIQKRREQVIQKLTVQGNLSAKFYEDLARVYGFDVTVKNHLSFQVGRSQVGDDLTNYNKRGPFSVGMQVGEQLNTVGWLHFFNVELPATTVEEFKVGINQVGDPLQKFGNELLECTYKRLKPAHSGITFTFR